MDFEGLWEPFWLSCLLDSNGRLLIKLEHIFYKENLAEFSEMDAQ